LEAPANTRQYASYKGKQLMPFTKESGYLQNLVEDGITFQDRDRDAVEKLRVSNPQSLIDTDFEYSLQNSKWEFLTLCINYPGVYARSNEPAFTSEQITSILPSGIGGRSVTVTVNTLPRSPFKIGDSVVLKETANTTFVDGAYVITAVFSEYSFEVVTKSPAALAGDQKTPYTALYTGGFYTNANIPINGVSAVGGTEDALIEFTHPHNLFIGTPIIVVDNSLSAVPWCGSFEVKTIPNEYSVTYETLTGENYPILGEINQITVQVLNAVDPDGGEWLNGTYTKLSGTVVGEDALFTGPNNNYIYYNGDFPAWFLYDTITERVAIYNNDLSDSGWANYGDYSELQVNVTSTGPGTLLISASGSVYARTEGVAVHRFFDGGVQINPGTSAPNARIMRQTRKYFKYQSGKSMQFSTGVLFRPVYEVTNAFINRTNYLNSIYLSAVNIVSEGSNEDEVTGIYIRPTSSTFFTTLTGPNNNTISYNTLSSFWELFAATEGDVIARNTSLYLEPTRWRVLSAYEALYAPLTATTNIELPPTYKFYDFEISTEQYHGFAQPDDYKEGCLIRVNGFDTNQMPDDPYNRTFRVANIVNTKTFQVQIPVDPEFNPFPSAPFNPGGLGFVNVLGWNDATVRTGLFDDQNGLFFEFDGKEFWVVKRQTTTPINGTVSVERSSPWVVSTDGNTKFRSQLKINDFINIQGMSYQIGTIYNDLSATITPTYRGPTAQGLKVIRTEELRVPQSEFNLDKLDGTGPSGYKLDLNRMQMMFIDYSWYGAGKVRYGIRAVNGKIIYFHEIYNNNVNIKAHMRSGNLPGRFEISSTSKTGTILQIAGTGNVVVKGLSDSQYNGTYILNGTFNNRPKYNKSEIHEIRWNGSEWFLINTENFNYTSSSNSGDMPYPWLATWLPPAVGVFSDGIDPTGLVVSEQTVAVVSKADADMLPTYGKIVINNEYIEYTKGADLPNNRVQLILDNRNVGGLTSGPKNHAEGSRFVSYNQNCSPALSHWGVAALMDGAFNEDKSYLFTGSNQTSMTATSADQALISVRLAPSVDYGIIGRLGERNLVNHSLLKPQTIGIVTNNPLQINVRVNCEPQTVFANLSAWKFVANGSIAQYYDHTTDGSFEVEGTGGDLIASFFVSPEAQIDSGQFTCKDFDIEVVRELTNSILGGDFPYPDGPDVVTISVKTLNNDMDYTAECRARLSWTEDQG